MSSPSSPRTRVRRQSQLADYERATLHAIVDAAHLCHIAFQDSHGTHCIPTACWRDGERLYVHGSNGGRLARQLGGGQQVSVAITHLDGLVLAKSALNHSMNYRSAVIYGCFETVLDEAEKRRLMDVFMHKLVPGREHEARRGNDKEFAATTLLGLPLAEAACKLRQGDPEDDAEDLDLPVWAGVLPLVLQPQPPQAAPHSHGPAPAYVRDWVHG